MIEKQDPARRTPGDQGLVGMLARRRALSERTAKREMNQVYVFERAFCPPNPLGCQL